MENENIEKLVRCPYNPHHQVKISRFQKHIFKCAQQHPHMKFEQCPFNVTHYVKTDEIEQHKATCSDKWKFEKYLLESATNHLSKDTPRVKVPKVEMKESWDHYNVKSYDPNEYCQENPVIRSCNGKSKKERQEFYAKEKERIETIKKTLPYI